MAAVQMQCQPQQVEHNFSVSRKKDWNKVLWWQDYRVRFPSLKFSRTRSNPETAKCMRTANIRSRLSIRLLLSPRKRAVWSFRDDDLLLHQQTCILMEPWRFTQGLIFTLTSAVLVWHCYPDLMTWNDFNFFIYGATYRLSKQVKQAVVFTPQPLLCPRWSNGTRKNPICPPFSLWWRLTSRCAKLTLTNTNPTPAGPLRRL